MIKAAVAARSSKDYYVKMLCARGMGATNDYDDDDDEDDDNAMATKTIVISHRKDDITKYAAPSQCEMKIQWGD